MIMPRPIGKYFGATITKFHAFKAREHIEIDENFRLQLRNNLLVEAGVIFHPKQPLLGERFFAWKQYIPLLPAVFLLTVAAFGLNRLPITFERDILVPKTTPKRVEEKSLLPSVQPLPTKIREEPGGSATGVFSQEKATETTQNAPPWGGQKPVTRGGTTAQEVDKAGLYEKSSNENEARGIEIRPLPPPVFFPEQLTESATKPSISPSQAPAPTPTPPNIVTPSPKPSQETKSSGIPGIPFLPPPPAPNPPPSVNPPAKAAPTYTPAATSAPEMKNPNLSTPAQEIIPQTQQQESFEPAKIYFHGKFSRDEKTLLKNEFIPGLIEGKDVLYVSVRDGPNEGFAIIEIYLNDGNVDTHVYNLHENAPE